MTVPRDFDAALLQSLAVALILSVSALAAAEGIRGRRSAAVLWGLAIAYLMPPCVVGYAYANFSLSLVHHPAANRLLYAALVLFRCAPVAALALLVSPPSLSPGALHCARLLHPRGSGVRRLAVPWVFRLRCGAHSFTLAFSLVFLLAFQEFEIASLLGTRSWTVTVFNAQAGGTSLAETLRLAAAPLLVTAAALGLGLAAVVARESEALTAEAGPARQGRVPTVLWLGAVLSVLALCAVPLAVVLRGTAAGFAEISALRFPLWREVASGAVLAGLAAVLAWPAGLAAAAAATPKSALARAIPACLPGLLGPLVLSLVLLPLIRVFGNSSGIPLIAALVLLLLPYSALLARRVAPRRAGGSEPEQESTTEWSAAPVGRMQGAPTRRIQCSTLRRRNAADGPPPQAPRPRRFLLRLSGPAAAPHATALHAAGLLEASSLAPARKHAAGVRWVLRGRRMAWVLFFLFCVAWFETTAPAILAPPGLATAWVRIQNLMHYGHSAVLSFMVVMCLILPIAACPIVFALCRAQAHWRPRD